MSSSIFLLHFNAKDHVKNLAFRNSHLPFLVQAIEYEVGDVLEVLPGQNPTAVDDFIQRCNLDPDAFITVSRFFVCWWL